MFRQLSSYHSVFFKLNFNLKGKVSESVFYLHQINNILSYVRKPKNKLPPEVCGGKYCQISVVGQQWRSHLVKVILLQKKKQIYSRQEAGPISPSIRFPNTVSTIFFLQIQKPLLCRSHLQASYWYHNEIKGIKLALVLFCRCGSSLKKRRKDCCTGCQKVLISSYFPTGKQSKQKLPCADLL